MMRPWLLGRMSASGHALARSRPGAGRRLVIAGNIADPVIPVGDQPRVDGERFTYVGEVDDGEKNRLLGHAAALLMPIEWDEPFGIVMAEAFACGTPVIGFAHGSVPEVVRDGVNGFVVTTVDDAVKAVAKLPAIDRGLVRRDCEERFSCEAIVVAYERLYREALA
jgi:glycosyltransferase involved in cell wall biosynthesis